MSKKTLHTSLLGRIVQWGGPDTVPNEELQGKLGTIVNVYVERESGEPRYDIEMDDGSVKTCWRIDGMVLKLVRPTLGS